MVRHYENVYDKPEKGVKKMSSTGEKNFCKPEDGQIVYLFQRKHILESSPYMVTISVNVILMT